VEVTSGLAGRRVLVTGVAGFIGFHVAKRLLQSGAIVHGYDNVNDYYDVRLKEARLDAIDAPAFSFSRADVSDYDRVKSVFAEFRPEYVIHLAAQAGVRYSLTNPRAYVSANIDGFLTILEACRSHGVNHLVYASSSSVYGGSTSIPFSEADPADKPLALYGATKRANELMAHSYAHLYGIAATGLRFFTVYGPWGRPDMALFIFTKAIIEGRPIDLYNNGQMRRDFTYVDDVTEAIERLVLCPPNLSHQEVQEAATTPPHAVYNIGNHTSVELERFVAAIEAALGRKAIRRLLPMQPGDVPATFANVDRLAHAVDFAPRTPIEEGVAKFVAWYRDFYRV
jgi:UDP-glucuronate 4-epimerase